jgi:exopolysaccharide biosynthesis polyprenyl glycosylphosphotransferase
MIRRHGSTLRAALLVTDGLLAALTLVATSMLRFGREWNTHWDWIIADEGAVLLIYGLAWVGVLAYMGLYRVRARWTIRGEAVDLAKATLVMAALTFAVLFWLRMPDVSRSYLLLLFPTQFVVTLATRAVLRVVFRRLRERGLNRRYVLVVGAGPRGQGFAAKLASHRELGLEIAGFVDDEQEFALQNGWRYRGALDDIERILHNDVVDEVAICLPVSQWSRIDAIAHLAEEEGKIVRVPMDFLDRTISTGRFEELDGTPVYSLVSGPDRLVGLALKRAIDLAVAVVGLVLLSPVFAAISLAIASRDGRPVLFRQTRVGLHGRPFHVVKFRTMTTDAEARYEDVVSLSDPRAFKLTDDPRVTPVGRFLRRTSLDELPQLWNVLRGEMSLVGPRPAPPREVAGYDLWHRRRLSMKPGITGLWQVTARRDEDFDNRAELDLSYIDRWSLWLDLKILLRTIPAALEGR